MPAKSALELVAILAAQFTAQVVLRSSTLAQMAFWMALWMVLTSDAKARATNGTYLGGWVGDRRHNVYLLSLPWVAMEPLSLSNEEQVALLGGYPSVGRPSRG